MSQADKFEFKNLHPFEFDCLRDSNRKHRTSLLEYKNLIKQLYEALAELSAKLDVAHSQLEQTKAHNSSLQEQIKIYNQDINTLQTQLQTQQSCRKNLQRQHASAKDNNKNHSQKTKQLNQQYEALSRQVAQSEQRINSLTSELSLKDQKITTMQETVGLLMTENRQLRRSIAQRENQTQWEIKELKLLNQQLKNKFSEIQFEPVVTRDYVRPFEESTNFKTKAHSTQKKSRRNNGFLLNTIDRDRPSSFFLHSNRHKSSKRYHTPAVNPELNEQFLNIKAEIANQYTLINLKKENYNKERVSRTLDQLQLRMKKMLHNAEQENETDECYE